MQGTLVYIATIELRPYLACGIILEMHCPPVRLLHFIDLSGGMVSSCEEHLIFTTHFDHPSFLLWFRHCLFYCYLTNFGI